MEEKYVQVRNLVNYPTVYLIPEEHIRQVFGPFETRMVKESELRKVYYQPGGAALFRNFLAVDDKNLAKNFGVSEDSFNHEYQMTKKDIDELLGANGNLDALKDALDFGPDGIKDLIVDRAVALRIPDITKREVISQATGKNINSMIANQVELERQLGHEQKTEKKERRVRDEEMKITSTGRRVQ